MTNSIIDLRQVTWKKQHSFPKSNKVIIKIYMSDLRKAGIEPLKGDDGELFFTVKGRQEKTFKHVMTEFFDEDSTMSCPTHWFFQSLDKQAELVIRL